MFDCVLCGDPIVKEIVKTHESSKKKHNLEKVCVWFVLDIIQGRIHKPEKCPK